MKDDKISRTQLMALLWAGVMAPAAELLPSLLLPGADRGAWLAVVLAAPLVLTAGWLLGSLAGREGLARGVTGLLGRWLGGAVLLFCPSACGYAPRGCSPPESGTGPCGSFCCRWRPSCCGWAGGSWPPSPGRDSSFSPPC